MRRHTLIKVLALSWVLPVLACLPAVANAEPSDTKAAQSQPRAPSAAPPAPATSPPVTTAPVTSPAVPAASPVQSATVTPPASPVTSEAEIKIPARPDDPRAAKVYGLLETHCARCHQAGKTGKLLPSGMIANILDIDALSRDTLLVKAGLPDASRLYDVIVSRHAPIDIYSNAGQQANPPPSDPAQAQAAPPASAAGEPEPEDIEGLRSWIKDLSPKNSACPDRKLITPAEISRRIAETVKAAKDDARDLRFLSLANIYNTCVSSNDMSGFRVAIVKLLNSLSWNSEPVHVTPLGDDGAVLGFKLSDLGWVSGHWDILQRIYPRGLVSTIPDDVKTAMATEVAVFQADWFADAASKPPLYYALLGIPAKLSELAKINGLDIEQNIKTARARRAVIRQSDVTRGNRLAERHPGARGTFWLSYDFATSSGDQDLFDHPLGPKASNVARSPFKPDLIRSIFALPNGLLGFALFDTSGNRIDRVPPGVEKPLTAGDDSASRQTSRAGANCFECHTQGIKPVRDDLKAQLAADKFTGPKDVREAALQLTAQDSDILQFSDGDEERYANALKVAGVDPGLRIAGIEPVNALARRYQSRGDVTTAAAGLGMTASEFRKLLAEAPASAQVLARRLQSGVLTRPDLDQLLGLLKPSEDAAAISAKIAKDVPKPPVKDDTGAVGLHLWIDKARPAPGDIVTVNAEADSDCYLTLVSVDNHGKATVLYPNDFETDNLIAAGKSVRVPGSEAPYQLRFKEAGQETILGQCSTSPVPPAGVEHDFERQRFTVLGNWENFIRDALVNDAELRRNPDRAEKLRAQRAATYQQRRLERGDGADKRPEPTLPNRNLRDGRAVIVIGNG